MNEGGRKGKETGGKVEEIGDRDSLKEWGKNYEEHAIFIKADIKADKKTVRKYGVHCHLKEITIFQGSSAFVTLRFLHRKMMLVRKYNISGHENSLY